MYFYFNSVTRNIQRIYFRLAYICLDMSKHIKVDYFLSVIGHFIPKTHYWFIISVLLFDILLLILIININIPNTVIEFNKGSKEK